MVLRSIAFNAEYQLEHFQSICNHYPLAGAVTADRELGWEAKSGRQLGDELLSNVSAEEGVSVPTDWFGSVSGSEWANTPTRSGLRSLRVHATLGTGWRSSSFLVDGDTIYRVRTFVIGTGSNQVFLTVRWFSNADGTGLIGEDNSMIDSTYSDWTQITGDFEAPAAAQSADVMFRAPAATTADIYADEFSVREVR